MVLGKQLTLKPQDLLVALKIATKKGSGFTYSELASELCMSVSEVHSAAKRAEIARLLLRNDEGTFAVRESLFEFVVHGVQYAFPPVKGGLVRGLPTAFAGPVLSKNFESESEIVPVWPDPEGGTRGVSFLPLYPSVPNAARRDPELYDLLTLVDALRGGAARDRELAKEELMRRLK